MGIRAQYRKWKLVKAKKQELRQIINDLNMATMKATMNWHDQQVWQREEELAVMLEDQAHQLRQELIAMNVDPQDIPQV